VVPIRKDPEGNDIGFVKPANNHHIAIYYDQDDKLVEHACTFWHAVERKKYGLPVVITNSNQAWEYLQMNNMEELPESFLNQLPPPGYRLKYSLQQNEMYVLGLPEEEVKSLIDKEDYSTLSSYLYRVQKISSKDYYFRHHLETQIVDNNDALASKRFYRIRSIKSLVELCPVKIKINLIGKPVI
jgi:CRISPR-associated endonuclease Csn1